MNNNIDKIIFLDLDHVLTNTDLDNSSFLSFDPSKYRLSEINMKWLDKILEVTDAKIVISSNWRRFIPPHVIWDYKGKEYRSILEPFKAKYRADIIDMLPAERHATKCECLELWFEDNSWFSKHGKYAILEDDTREKYQEHHIYSKHLILTNYRFGLTETDADKAISFLT